MISPFTCKAGNLPGFHPLPHHLQFQKDKNRTTKILTALLYEHSKRYRRSRNLWGSFPSSNSQVQYHIFYNDLALNQISQSAIKPINSRSRLLLSRYQSWQRKWKTALDTLQKDTDSVLRIEVVLEQIRLYLLLGQYKEAGIIIEKFNPTNHREQMQLEVFTIWLSILKGNRKKASHGIDKLEENYLYLPVSTMFPVDYIGSDKQLGSLLRSGLMRFPSNQELFEQFVMFLSGNREWQALGELIRSQKHVNSSKLDWNLEAEIYLNTDQIKRLESLIKSRHASQIGPHFYDVVARLAIKRKNWELLLQVAKSYRSHFPDLKDGVIYHAIYLQETGRQKEGNELLRQVGL